MNAGLIRGTPHHAIQRIDLCNKMTLADTANCGIAGHLSDGFDVLGQ